MTWDKKVPFDEKGNLLHKGHSYNTQVVWKENFIFTSTLKVTGYYQHENSSGFYLADVHTGEKFLITLKNFQNVIPVMSAGCALGTWTFLKHGHSFSLKLVK